MAVDSFNNPASRDETQYTKVQVVVGAEELTKSIGRGGFLDKVE